MIQATLTDLHLIEPQLAKHGDSQRIVVKFINLRTHAVDELRVFDGEAEYQAFLTSRLDSSTHNLAAT